MTSETERLFIYGSLQPGGPNEHMMTAIGGEWEPAFLNGRLVDQGWGAELGFPGLVLDESASAIRGHVFTSTNLNRHWDRLDAFEGAEYVRVMASAELGTGERVPAYVYVLRKE